jgi:hypothetical protein
LQRSVQKYVNLVSEWDLSAAQTASDLESKGTTERALQKLFNGYEHIEEAHSEYLCAKRDWRDISASLPSDEEMEGERYINQFKEARARVAAKEHDLLLLKVDVRSGVRQTNEGYLKAAVETHDETTNKLKEALAKLHSTSATAAVIESQLASNRAVISAAATGLEGVESELHLANRLVTNHVKRIATDKVIVAATGLVVGGAVAAGMLAL